jgi:hypothetical protein
VATGDSSLRFRHLCVHNVRRSELAAKLNLQIMWETSDLHL